MMARGRSVSAGYQYPTTTEETHGPWVGVQDGPAATEGDRQHANMIRNGWIPNPGQGAIVPRPGFQVLNVSVGTVGGVPQGLAVYKPLGQPPINYAFFSGRMFQVDPGGNGIVTPIVPAGVTIDPTARFIYTVNFNNKLVVTDGVNPPWTWDGTTATPISFDVGAPGGGVPANSVAWGPPTVYYDQLFFIRAAQRSTLVWSEPNNPALGYVQLVAGFQYADDWILEQTGTNDLTCILGTNDTLFYWRDSSIGALSGSPALSFRTTATHDAISSQVGTISPRCVVEVDQEVYFLDQTGKPMVIERGGFLTDMWHDCYTSFVGPGQLGGAYRGPTGGPPSEIAYGWSGCYQPTLRCVLWAFGDVEKETLGHVPGPDQIAVFDVRTKKYVGLWSHSSTIQPAIQVYHLALLANPNAVGLEAPNQLIWHLDQNGNVYHMRSPFLQQSLSSGLVATFIDSAGLYVDRSVWNPAVVNFNLYAIELQVETSEMMYDPWSETEYDRVQWVTLPYTFCNVNLDYRTARSTTPSVAQNVSQPVTAGTLRSEIDVGVAATARAARFRITNTPQAVVAASGTVNVNCIAVAQCKVRGFKVDQNAGAP